MASGDDVLDRLAPASGWSADWAEVLDRADVNRRAGLVTKARLILVLVVVAFVLVPLAALAAANDWWFMKVNHPTPTHGPVVVKEGEWAGQGWQLIAYPSTTDGLCMSMTPTASASKGEGGAMECSTLASVARTATTKASPDMTITYLIGARSAPFPNYIAGPVIETATTVAIRFGDGELLRVPTFSAPEPLDHVRFYATQLPASVEPPSMKTFRTFVKWIAGLDSNGKVVACLAPSTAENGISSLSDCPIH
jgi:hypothetical protein